MQIANEPVHILPRTSNYKFIVFFSLFATFFSLCLLHLKLYVQIRRCYSVITAEPGVNRCRKIIVQNFTGKRLIRPVQKITQKNNEVKSKILEQGNTDCI